MPAGSNTAVAFGSATHCVRPSAYTPITKSELSFSAQPTAESPALATSAPTVMVFEILGMRNLWWRL
jgi:hypothetical protein